MRWISPLRPFLASAISLRAPLSPPTAKRKPPNEAKKKQRKAGPCLIPVGPVIRQKEMASITATTIFSPTSVVYRQPKLTGITSIRTIQEHHHYHHHKNKQPSSAVPFTTLSLNNMASSDVLSKTLYTITSVKLDQLDKQKAAFESGKRALLEDAAYETSHRKRAKLLVEQVEKLPAMSQLSDGHQTSVDNLKRFVKQAEYDPCISEDFLREYEDAVRKGLDVESAKYRFAELYGKLVNEWISAGEAEDQNAESGFVPVGREEMHTQRATWEDYVFKAKETDGAAIKGYLEQLFCESKDVKSAFTSLKETLKTFQERWDDQPHFDENSLEDTIRGLLRINILTDQKRTILNDFLNNKVVLREIADVLNMRMQTRQNWAWDGDVMVEQRRQLNGRYRFFPDEDLLQSIFIHHIGTRWGVKMREVLTSFLSRYGVQRAASKPMTKEEVLRWRFFLKLGDRGYVESKSSMENQLAKHWREEILLDQLPQTHGERRGGYNSDSVDDGREDDSRKSHIDVVQSLLHLIQSEIIIHQGLGSDITVIRSDLKWFGPSVPHSSIFAVLEFFGVEAEWVDLFRRILEAPHRFKQDPPDAPAQSRKRGVPLSTPLADFLSETVLFCMDFAVNQKGDGCRLYRLHDDMWLWGGEEMCGKAWRTMGEFVRLTGLDFNEDKTGSVRIRARGNDGGNDNDNGNNKNTGQPSVQGRLPLPKGDVVWGFLKLDPASGRFVLDQDKIDGHIEELRLQLEACGSVFDWIQAWNIYGSRFFATNCGQVANCFSRAHVDSMLATFHRIQQTLFGDGGAGGHLRRLISERFGIVDIPDGYLYFPVSLGGLGLQNPFIHLYLIRDNVLEDPSKAMDDFLEEEETSYRRYKEVYEASEGHPLMRAPGVQGLFDQPFMSFEEFTRHRRRTSTGLQRVLTILQKKPKDKPIELTGDVTTALSSSSGGWYGLSAYEQWICGLYAKDMIARFGSLVIVDEGLLPTGLLDMLRQSRFKWSG
ncbi:uncharacterized protein CTRU02_201843 [Colletotrichum truncatum]|uniref:Uncharacterized protein n=1 Tax=Colletotrichum truncatum TaxID=5467 RepID=A0ACC3ZIK3_COLTU|nr:uncharacterized protein CTRU02_06956 [Colletotrichum truncatum]KAF6791772.1 hypothetical protein CTRU02_06956 [Colletotrichum truncatum]